MGFLKREIQVQHGRILHRSHATSGYVGLSQPKKQKLEAAGSSGAVQALRMENDAPVVGPDAPTANSKMVKLDNCDRGLESANFRFASSVQYRQIQHTRRSF